MVFQNDILAGASGSIPTYSIDQSIRFPSPTTGYLNRTPSSASNRKTWTWSGWIKRSKLATLAGNADAVIFGADGGSSNFLHLRIDGASTNADQLYLVASSSTMSIRYAPLLRDVSAWYHIVIRMDTTDGTAADRAKVYLNGAQITDIVSSTYPSLNREFAVNNTVEHDLGRLSYAGSETFEGYMSEINFVDGTALDATSFGEYNDDGVWIPKEYAGAYGTNGWYLTGATAADLGEDFSGNGHDWTSTGLDTDDQVVDTPTKNYATLTSLIPVPSGTISNGNLDYTRGSTAAHGSVGSSFTLPTTGKWYWEVTAAAAGGNNEAIGVANILNNPQLPAASAEIGSRAGDFIYRSNAVKVSGGTSASYGVTFTSGDIIGVAWNSDDGEITFFKNNSTQGVAYSSISQEAGKYVPADSQAQTGVTVFNFGQSGFEYTPPTGFKALNTANLPTPTIADGSTNFNVVLYTGTGSVTRSVTGVGFQPDLVYNKQRNNTSANVIANAVSGANTFMATDQTTAESSFTNSIYGYLSSFDSDGYTLTPGSTNNNYWNENAKNFVSYNWLAGNGTASNEDGSINTTATSVNTAAGISISTYTGTAATATIGHGLGVVPAMIIVKKRNAAERWTVFHRSTSDAYIYLNETFAAETSNAALRFGNDSAVVQPTSTVFTVGTSNDVNSNSNQYLAYCFAEVEGFSKFDSYTGNGSADGSFIYTGFSPAFVIIKCSSVANSWTMYDTTRQPYNANGRYILAESSAAEVDSTTVEIDILSNGFKARDNQNNINGSGRSYIYLAFASNPFGGDGVAPATAR
jgi:hypothetical protein